jgi:hypothetical protein
LATNLFATRRRVDLLAQMGSSEPSDSAPGPAVPETTGVGPRLAAARDRLDAGDLPGALAIYDEVLAVGGDRADVLVTISGDLGATGNIPKIIELVAPRYDAGRHGPATGLNLVQAFLAVGDADAAQHVLDILFSLNRPELEDRLHGFSNAIAELMSQGAVAGIPGSVPAEAAPEERGVALVTISKPIWSYGLEEFGEILPKKEGKMRRIAFTQLSLPGAYADFEAAMREPEDELARMSRAIPLWFAETFYFSPIYNSVAALGCDNSSGVRRPVIFPVDWGVENLRKLVQETQGGLDYVFIGSLRREGAETVLALRVVEVKKMRERKQFTVRWTTATADAELAKLHEAVRAYMEWAPYPEGSGLPYAAQSCPTAWLDALGALLGMFLVEKKLMPKEQLPALSPTFDVFATHAFSPPASSLAWIMLRARATALGLQPSLSEVLLSRHAAVVRARALIGS